MYKIETHLHTTNSSRCSKLTVKEIAKVYHEAGYSGICVTDHYTRITFEYLGVDIYSDCDKLTPFLGGYYALKEECQKYGIRVYKGAELRFDECDNDYLLLGWNNNLLSNPAEVFEMGIAKFSRIARNAGAVIIQAHPYRETCTPAFACYLDGVEIYNMHPRHDSHNDWAKEYMDKFGLIGTCGSDAHQPEDMARGGIIVEKDYKDTIGIARAILYRRFENITDNIK